MLVGALLALALGLLASPAGAAETTVNCGGLQGALSGAKAGDRITLNELCKGGFPYKLPSLPVTLAGTPGRASTAAAPRSWKAARARPRSKG